MAVQTSSISQKRALSGSLEAPRGGGGEAAKPTGASSFCNTSAYPEFTLNNIVEQDHRGVKRVTRPMLGFKSFEAAQSTLAGIELMHMIKKQQMMVEAGDEGLTATEQFYALAS